jgi:hypothetical protein
MATSASAWSSALALNSSRVASFLERSPLGEVLCALAASVRPPSAALAVGGLESVARRLSPATCLAIVGGVVSKRLAERLSQYGETISALLTARLRRQPDATA